MAKAPKTIDEYLSRLTADKRRTLQAIREAVAAAAPGGEECISYQVPAFRFNGRVTAWFAAATNYCSFFPGAHPIVAHAAALARYETAKGTVRFPVDRPLPATLVKKLVRTRIAELAAKAPAKSKPAKPAKPAKAKPRTAAKKTRA